MNNPFKVGDKVRCVDAGDNIGLTYDKIYEVKGVYKDSVSVASDGGGRFLYMASRFEKVEDTKNLEPKRTWSASFKSSDGIEVRSEKLIVSVPNTGNISVTPQEARELMNKLRVALRKHGTLNK